MIENFNNNFNLIVGEAIVGYYEFYKMEKESVKESENKEKDELGRCGKSYFLNQIITNFQEVKTLKDTNNNNGFIMTALNNITSISQSISYSSSYFVSIDNVESLEPNIIPYIQHINNLLDLIHPLLEDMCHTFVQTTDILLPIPLYELLISKLLSTVEKIKEKRDSHSNRLSVSESLDDKSLVQYNSSDVTKESVLSMATLNISSSSLNDNANNANNNANNNGTNDDNTNNITTLELQDIYNRVNETISLNQQQQQQPLNRPKYIFDELTQKLYIKNTSCSRFHLTLLAKKMADSDETINRIIPILINYDTEILKALGQDSFTILVKMWIDIRNQSSPLVFSSSSLLNKWFVSTIDLATQFGTNSIQNADTLMDTGICSVMSVVWGVVNGTMNKIPNISIQIGRKNVDESIKDVDESIGEAIKNEELMGELVEDVVEDAVVAMGGSKRRNKTKRNKKRKHNNKTKHQWFLGYRI